jgi:hypothetical protein
MPGAADAAWPLAQALYADGSLRPAHLDDAHARVLCGDPAPTGTTPDLREIAETLAAVRGEDAPSKALLAEIARRVGVAQLVVVHVEDGKPAVARVFMADSHEFDAATYVQDAAPGVVWAGAARSIARAFGTVAPPHTPPGAPASPSAAPVLATRETPKTAESKPSRPFYLWPWFWGALGVAAATGGAVYLLSRDTGSSTIHLQVQGP